MQNVQHSFQWTIRRNLESKKQFFNSPFLYSQTMSVPKHNLLNRLTYILLIFICTGDRCPKENQPADGFPLPAKDSEDDSLVFLKHLNMELQQIKKHLSLEERQDDPESVAWDKTMVLVEKGLYYTRLILSVIFLAVIIIQWTRWIIDYWPLWWNKEHGIFVD